MQILSKRLPVSHQIFIFGDTHIGSSAVHYEGINKLKREILSKENNYAIHLGDAIEAITVDDKRFNTETATEPIPIQQAYRFMEIFKPLKDRMLVQLAGNHELKLHRVGNITRDIICKQLGIPYGTYQSRLTILDGRGRQQYKMFLTHGFGSIGSVADDPIRRLSNHRLTLKRKLQPFSGDCVISAMGHCHKLIVAEPEKELFLTDDGDEIKAHYTKPSQHEAYIDPNLRWYCCTGSFLKLYGPLGTTTYSEIAGYPPVELGYIKVIVEDRQIVSVEKVVL